MRQNLYDILKNMDFNVQAEYERLFYLFACEPSVLYPGRNKTIAEYIDSTYFRSLPIRGTYLHITDMLDALNLSEFIYSLDDLLLFCEFIFAVIPDEQYQSNPLLANSADTLLHNISIILEKTNHQLASDAEGNPIIIEKNKEAILAAQLVEKEVSFEILEYNHFALKGDLEGKRKILNAIVSYVEPILNSHAIRDNGFSQLESDARFVFNNFHIRHNNKEGTKSNDYIAAVNSDDLEEWYDKAYQLAISIIIMADYQPIKQEIQEIKKQYTFKN